MPNKELICISPLTTLTTVCMVIIKNEAKPNTEKALPAGHVVLRADAADAAEVALVVLVLAVSVVEVIAVIDVVVVNLVIV